MAASDAFVGEGLLPSPYAQLAARLRTIERALAAIEPRSPPMQHAELAEYRALRAAMLPPRGNV